MARLVEFHSRSTEYPGLDEVVDALLDATWRAERPSNAYHALIQEAVQSVTLDRLIAQAGSADAAPQVRAVLALKLAELVDWLNQRRAPTAHERQGRAAINRWQQRPEGTTEPSRAPSLPPGSPIGGR